MAGPPSKKPRLEVNDDSGTDSVTKITSQEQLAGDLTSYVVLNSILTNG